MALEERSTSVEGQGQRADGWRRFWRALFSPTSPQLGAATTASSIGSPLSNLGLINALIEGLPVPAIALDREARVIAFNAPAAAIAPALRRGEPALITLRMPELVDAIRRAGTTREPQRVEFFERVPLDRWFEAFVVPLKGTAGPAELLLTINDLSPLRRVEEMRADFVANASHELRTPLAALLGFIETLQGSAKEDAA
ncbi:MAG: hypothetical protein JO237_01545, partial [Pseudolabrys sp.]|nr:hypothetical protein [Pseudolabrys sp.]